jgi:phenylpropionate dioxygenase-like ring-hydroxylating dioxygenase large terminal subunit
MLDKKWYTKKKYFEYEINNIFNDQWIFAGLVTDLKNNNDFITLEIGKSSVVVQNFKGSLVAFQNICSHRFKRIQTEVKGNRPFFCEYHGWNYDKNGSPRIPKENTFDIQNSSCLKLKKYKLATCGNFVFVNLNSESNIILEEHLGDYFKELEEISKHLNLILNESKIILHKSNWKLLVENVLEGYHCPIVHKESLVDLGYCIDFPNEMKFHNNHSSWHSPKIKKGEDSVNAKLNFMNDLTYKHESFYHIYIYPNLFISSTSGSFFYIGNLVPKSKNESNLICNFFGANYNRDLNKKESSLSKAMFTFNVESANRVLFEDKPMVESCQKGLEERSNIQGILSSMEEIRIVKFHETVNKKL